MMTTEPADNRPFQARVHHWVVTCFGATGGDDRYTRQVRFLEESLELFQAGGCTEDDAHKLVAYVFSRHKGEIVQEVGGVMLTLAALCSAYGIDLSEAAELELARVWTKIDQVRARDKMKPTGPTPGSPP
jgi:NTP pyrophosphatase (non-canonical NTP hydrolase)